jgi:bifunctional DNase/RNase
MEITLEKMIVSDLRNSTFYAKLILGQNGRTVEIDSRPSDALALALRVDCPIFVDEEVLKNSKISSAFSERNTNEQLRTYLEGLSDDDLGRYKM